MEGRSSAGAGSDPGVPHAVLVACSDRKSAIADLRKLILPELGYPSSGNPGGLTRPRVEGRTFYPPLAEPHTGATVFGNTGSARPGGPCDARQVRRAPRGLGRFRPGALRPVPETTAARPAPEDALETPLVEGTGQARI